MRLPNGHFIILGTGANNFILGELMWPVDPVAIKSLKFDNEIYLIVYSTISVDIFDVLKGTIFPAYALTRAPTLKLLFFRWMDSNNFNKE